MRIDLYIVYRNGKRYDRLERFLKYCKKKGIKKNEKRLFNENLQ